MGATRTLPGSRGPRVAADCAPWRVRETATSDPDRFHLARLPAAEVTRAAGELTAMSRAKRAALPFMHPGRVDVIGVGALVLSVITEHLGLPEVLASEHDILDGIALFLA